MRGNYITSSPLLHKQLPITAAAAAFTATAAASEADGAAQSGTARTLASELSVHEQHAAAFLTCNEQSSILSDLDGRSDLSILGRGTSGSTFVSAAYADVGSLLNPFGVLRLCQQAVCRILAILMLE